MKRQYRLCSLFFSLLISLIVLGVSPIYAEDDWQVVMVEDKYFPHTESFDAVIEAIHHSTVSSRIAAQVIELNFDVNDVVAKGAVIMRFEDTDFQARVAQVQANISADRAQSREAIARQKEASSEANRVASLFNRKLLAQAALDKATADLGAANAKVQAINAQIKSRQAQLDEAKVQLSYTQIVAPYAGVVTDRLIELGEMASPGQALMTGVSLHHLRAIVKVPQYLVTSVKAATGSTLSLLDGRQITGGKITLIPQADRNSHSFELRVDLPRNSENIYPGMFATLDFMVGEEQIRVIPQSAIVQRSEVSGVYVQAEDKTLTFRHIRLGRRLAGQQQEILAGLSVGERVAINPLEAMRRLKLQAWDLRDE